MFSINVVYILSKTFSSVSKRKVIVIDVNNFCVSHIVQMHTFFRDSFETYAMVIRDGEGYGNGDCFI